ncbi:MAG: hypothetical protein WC551_08935 [Patescibacteria group bacterium]
MNKPKARMIAALLANGFVKCEPDYYAHQAFKRDYPWTRLDAVLAGAVIAEYDAGVWTLHRARAKIENVGPEDILSGLALLGEEGAPLPKETK